MEDNYPSALKESWQDRVVITIKKEGPYLLRFLLKSITGFIFWVIKSLKTMLFYFFQTMKNAIKW